MQVSRTEEQKSGLCLLNMVALGVQAKTDQGEPVCPTAQLLPNSRSRPLSWPTPKSPSTLEQGKGPSLLIQSCTISMAQGNSKITRRSPCEDLILVVSQKPEFLKLINDSLQ